MSSELACVVGPADGPATPLAAGLRGLGLQVAAHDPAPRQELARRLRDAGVPRLVVWVPAPGAAATRRPMDELAPSEWDALAAQPLRDGVACVQAALDVMTAGAVVAVLPTLAMNGSAGLTAWATAAEGLRSLVKVAARELAPRAVTVNAVAVPAQSLAGTAESLNRPGLPPARLAAAADPLEAAADVVAALASPPWQAVTGATIAVDGGVWMPA